MDPDAKLSFIERFAYGIGDYAGNHAALDCMRATWYTRRSVRFCSYIIQTL